MSDRRQTCPRCDGAGEIDLSGRRQHVVDTLSEGPVWRPTAQLASDAGFGHSAAHNILTALLELDFVERRTRPGPGGGIFHEWRILPPRERHQ